VYYTGPVSNQDKDHKETAVVFLYNNGDWSVLPTDLIEVTPDTL